MGSMTSTGAGFVVVWMLGLLIVFSFLPITPSPRQFISKQTDYMSILLAPSCLKGGWFLAGLNRVLALMLLGAYLAPGIVLGGLAQRAIRVYIANAKAAATYAENIPVTPFYSSRRVSNVSHLRPVFSGSEEPQWRILPLTVLARDLGQRIGHGAVHRRINCHGPRDY